MRQKVEDPFVKQVNIHLTAAEKTRLDNAARYHERSVSQLVRIVVQFYLNTDPTSLRTAVPVLGEIPAQPRFLGDRSLFLKGDFASWRTGGGDIFAVQGATTMRQKVEDPFVKQVNIHLTAAEKTRLDNAARHHQRSVSQLVRIIVQSYLNTERPERTLVFDQPRLVEPPAGADRSMQSTP